VQGDVQQNHTSLSIWAERVNRHASWAGPSVVVRVLLNEKLPWPTIGSASAQSSFNAGGEQSPNAEVTQTESHSSEQQKASASQTRSQQKAFSHPPGGP
jgi:hypothetical protein